VFIILKCSLFVKYGLFLDTAPLKTDQILWSCFILWKTLCK